MIKIILINIFCRIKSNIFFNSFNYASSNISLRIKGTGLTTIFGEHSRFNFTSLYIVKEVKINGLKKDINIYNRYYFDKEDNLVETTLDDNITDCCHMFYGCNKITEINFNNFDTSKVTNMFAMFCNCASLISLDLHTFDTSQVTDMGWMFNGCLLLTSLDLSNFITSNLKISNKMFLNCRNLEYIHFQNFDESKITTDTKFYLDMFLNISANAVICINETITQYKIFPQIKENITCSVIDCTNNWKSKQKKLYIENNECNKSLDNALIFKCQYENDENCYSNCLNERLYDKNNNIINICKCQLDKFLFYKNPNLTKDSCPI